MPTRKAKPPTRAEHTRNGHVAAVFRQLLKERDWSPGDFNKAIGKEAGHTQIYMWLNAKGTPGPKTAAQISAQFNIPISDLTPTGGFDRRAPGMKASVASRRSAANGAVWVEPPANAPGKALVVSGVAAARRSSPLSFVIDPEGVTARLQLDITLPVADGFSLMNMIREANVLLSRPP